VDELWLNLTHIITCYKIKILLLLSLLLLTGQFIGCLTSSLVGWSVDSSCWIWIYCCFRYDRLKFCLDLFNFSELCVWHWVSLWLLF